MEWLRDNDWLAIYGAGVSFIVAVSAASVVAWVLCGLFLALWAYVNR